MRLHELEITAFGPFADTVTIDFDALSEAGLFLMTGATGAGKTSVLDAVCFALYGDVPGDRAAAKRLRSDQAAAGVAPRVSLDCTLSGRRFRIVRSPAWERPKKRGAGTTVQQASVTLSERCDGRWQALSTRLDETGHLITHLLGMNLAQFTQVAMLPQGRFQTFLRARSEERHRLLQQLFRTGRFEAVETWLRERRLALAAESRGRHRLVADLASRLSEAAATTPPEAWDLRSLDEVTASGELTAWADGLVAEASLAARASSAAAQLAAVAAQTAAASLEEGRLLAARQARLESARAERALLRDREPAVADLRRRYDLARRAAPVLPLARAADEAAADLRTAEQQLAAALAGAMPGASPTGSEPDTEAGAGPAGAPHPTRLRSLLDAHRDAVTRSAGEVAALLPVAARAEELRELVEGDAERLRELTAELAVVAEARAGLPLRLSDLRRRVAEAEQAAVALPAAGSAVDRTRLALSGARDAVHLATELVVARDVLRGAVDEAQARKEHWLAVQEERITGMAAELAGRLAVGGCCPVCGSAEHPAPASGRADAPDSRTERRARSRLDDAEAERLAREGAVRDLETRLALARQAAGGETPEVLLELLAREVSEVDRLEQLAELVPTLAAELAAAEADAADHASRQEFLVDAVARLTARLDAHRSELAASAERVTALLRAHGAEDLTALTLRHEAQARAYGDAIRALQLATTARSAHVAASRRLELQAQEAGFADSASAVGAAATAAELAAWAAELSEHDATVAACARLLADPELATAGALPAPDLVRLKDGAEAAAEALAAGETAARLGAARVRRLQRLRERLGVVLADWAPLRADLELATGLSALADGKSADNRLQMRLSAYVLAARLGQVVAAANERLATMSDRRYSLEHSARRGAGETRGGLSLLVRDDWSGETRDPATLSGGETFVVSLALALGLADVITQEAGGADLDTLFVDEGFGALDADTLDDVMDTLDSLRDGGRVVGVVSHVPEMRDRIPTRLAVRKHRSGSTVSLERTC